MKKEKRVVKLIKKENQYRESFSIQMGPDAKPIDLWTQSLRKSGTMPDLQQKNVSQEDILKLIDKRVDSIFNQD